MRITLEEQKADLETAAKVTEELVDGLAEETRKRQVAEVELANVSAGAISLERGWAIVHALVEDIRDRKGLEEEWSLIDEDTKTNLLEEWVRLVRETK